MFKIHGNKIGEFSYFLDIDFPEAVCPQFIVIYLVFSWARPKIASITTCSGEDEIYQMAQVSVMYTKKLRSNIVHNVYTGVHVGTANAEVYK